MIEAMASGTPVIAFNQEAAGVKVAGQSGRLPGCYPEGELARHPKPRRQHQVFS